MPTHSTTLPTISVQDVNEACGGSEEAVSIVNLSQESSDSFEFCDTDDALPIPDWLFTVNEDGDTYLHTAIILQNIPLIMKIINKMASSKWLSFQNKLLQTPLHLAVLTKQVCVVSKLVALRADVLSRDKNGNTPFTLACRNGMTDIVKCLISTIQRNDSTSCKRSLFLEVISIANYEGLNCLHLAANNGHLDIVRDLIESGADVNIPERKTGRSILHNACIKGDIKLVRLLTKLKACNLNARTYDGLTPFDLARNGSDNTICMVLAAAGARYGFEEVEEL